MKKERKANSANKRHKNNSKDEEKKGETRDSERFKRDLKDMTRTERMSNKGSWIYIQEAEEGVW